MTFSIDKISSLKFRFLKFHITFWLAFVIYEIFLSGLISGIWSNYWDYSFHYALYICLFYFHANVALKRNYKSITFNVIWIIIELMFCFGFNILIVYLFKLLHIATVIKSLNSLFFLASAYRFTFILILSTAYWYMLTRVHHLQKIHQQEALLLKVAIQNERLQTEKKEEQLKKQKSSIIPHFLFNTLHVLYHQLRKDKPEEAGYLMSLSEMMQYNLSPLNQQYKIPLSDEVAYLQNYLKLRLMERDYALKIHIHIPEDQSDDLFIIPLLLATLVENIFHHGDLYRPKRPAYLKIGLTKNKLRVRIGNEIKSNLKRPNGMGIENMLDRLRHFYPEGHHYKSYQYRNTFIQKLYVKLS